MLSTMVSKVTFGLVSILLIACSLLYMNRLSLEKEIIKKDAKITEIARDRDLLSAEKQRLLNIQKANDEITQKKEIVSKELSGHLDTTLNELKKTSKTEKRGNENAGKTSPDTPLDSDIIRVLDDLCYKVRGTKCPNP